MGHSALSRLDRGAAGDADLSSHYRHSRGEGPTSVADPGITQGRMTRYATVDSNVQTTSHAHPMETETGPSAPVDGLFG